jgi:hypothetical protein
MSVLKSFLITSLATLGLAQSSNAATVFKKEYGLEKQSSWITAFQDKITNLRLAAHRSHASHGSHGSHRSSAGGTGYTPPNPTPPVSLLPKPQPPKPTYSIATKVQVMQVQVNLYRLSFYWGEIDGLMGPKTTEALVRYQIQYGLSPTGNIDAALLAHMRIN